MSVDAITSESKSKMEKAVAVLQGELKGFRTGRASTAETLSASFFAISRRSKDWMP